LSDLKSDKWGRFFDDNTFSLFSFFFLILIFILAFAFLLFWGFSVCNFIF